MIKAAFFEVDGTLLSKSTNHLIPPSTKAALAELRRRGVKCVLCTGRPPIQLPPCIAEGFPGFEGGFDAYVTMTGSLCYDAEGTYFDVRIDRDPCERLVEQIEAGAFDAIVLTRENSWASCDSERIHELERMVASTYPIRDPRLSLDEGIYQFCVFVPPAEQGRVEQIMSDCIVARWCDLFCDVVPATSSKPAGVRATMEHFGLEGDEAIAFGDGGNDATMLQYCTVGVAMGNGTDEAKAAADYVTDNIEDDGIANALRHFGLID